MKTFEAINIQACQAIEAYIDAEIARLRAFHEIVERARKDGASQIITTGRNDILHGFVFPRKPDNYSLVPRTDVGELPFPVYRPDGVDLAAVSRSIPQIAGVPPITVTDDGKCIVTSASRKEGRYYVAIPEEAGIDSIPGFVPADHAWIHQERRVSRPWGKSNWGTSD